MSDFKIDKEIGKLGLVKKIPPYFIFHPNSVIKTDGRAYDVLPTSIAQVDSSEYKPSILTEEQRQELAYNVKGVPIECPLWMRLEGEEWWLLPYEPIITINGKNIITKKQVAKGKVRGSIKERWTQDDYQISINGIFINPKGTGYPSEDVKKLKRLCEAAKVQVMCPLFEVFSIDQIVIESFDFPFTSGPDNQAYTIGAVSDDIYKLLLREEDLKM